RGNFDRRRYGEVLELRDATLATPPLRATVLSDPIASTALAHRGYREFLGGVVRDFGVDAVVVSSLIGHSLDALCSGLPTTYFIHDFYPLWPLLHRNLDDAAVTFDATQLRADLAAADAGFEFAERDPDWWLALRERVADAALAAHATLVAPSRSAVEIFLKLQPRLAQLPQHVIPHGIAAWPATARIPLPAAPVHEKLRLMILGRVRRGKASHLLRKLLPHLRNVELFLIGAGPEAREFFGQAGVHILLNYKAAELPALLARVAPDCALILPDFAETFSYTLSELRSFGIPVLATRLGALAERIADGADGFLVAPDAVAIAAAIETMRANPDALARVRDTLAQQPLRTLADMAAGYRDLLPLAPRPRTLKLPAAGLDRIDAQMRASLIGESRRKIAALEDAVASKQRELEHRAEWAFGLDAKLKRNASALYKLRNEFDERSAWALRLDAEVRQVREERDRVVGSLSWRITRPLRYAMRKLRGLRVRLGFAASRLRAIMHRTRGSLASRGVAGTIRRAADEFRRGAAPPNGRIVAAPTSDFSPFAVPASAAPRVSIVIPAFNKIDYTVACLRSLAAHPGV
ncbi:MAG TPA: glycosyltransferase, partial [Rudaea sp.]|nr:glycosyltransferase [Rudaea sp.]